MGLGSLPQRAHRRRPGLPSRAVPALILCPLPIPPVGSYLSSPPRPPNSPHTAPSAELRSRYAPWAPGACSRPGARGRDGGSARAGARAPAQ